MIVAELFVHRRSLAQPSVLRLVGFFSFLFTVAQALIYATPISDSLRKESPTSSKVYIRELFGLETV